MSSDPLGRVGIIPNALLIYIQTVIILEFELMFTSSKNVDEYKLLL